MKRFLFFLLTFLLAGCVTVTVNMPGEPTPTPAGTSISAVSVDGPGATPTSGGIPTSTAYIPEALGPTPTPYVPETLPGLTPTPTAYTPDPNFPRYDLTTVPPPDSAPRTLYFLVQNGLWMLPPNAEKAVRLTSEDTVVTAFDVWQDGGRIAFATRSGKLYTQNPGKDPMLFLKIEDAPYPAYVNSIAWSPDGSQLAYTVTYDNGGQAVFANYPSKPSGLWIAPLQGGKPTWLMSNHYPQFAAAQDAAQFRRLVDPEWSPDGQALIIHGMYWEWTNTHWIYPLEYAEDDRNLHTYTLTAVPGNNEFQNGNVGATWGHAAWTTDSQGLIFSSQENVTFGDVAYISRDGSQSEMWQSGKGANLYIADAHMVPIDSYLPGTTSGINAGPGRMLYIGDCPVCQPQPATRIFVMKTRFVDPSMNGSIVGPAALCTQKDSFGNPNQPRHIEWNPDFSLGVLACGSNEIYLVNMHRPEPVLSDLLSFLPPLTPQEVPTFRWGERK